MTFNDFAKNGNTMPEIVFAKPEICPLCNAHVSSTLEHHVASSFGTGEYRSESFDILQCSECGLGLTSPVPTPETAAALYAERASNDFQPDDSGFTARIKTWFARRDARTFARHTPHPRTILDYGCGNGEFVRAFTSLYPDAEVTGADFHPTAPPMLAHSGADYVTMDDLPQYTGRFDLVIARHVLEHTYTPIESLSLLRSMLAPNGSIVIEVPCLKAGARHLFGKYWAGYYTPYHPIHFTRQSLTLAFESAGFFVVEHGNAELPIMGRSIQNVLGCEYNLGLFGLGVMLHPLQLAMSFIVRNPTALRVWATSRTLAVAD
jgi:SAM-dependent methyltransferase